MTTGTIMLDAVTTLPIDSIRLDGGTQPRANLDFDVVEEYVEAMEAGAKFPPVDVFYDGSEYWLAHGFHRIRAADACENPAMESFPCTIHQGTVEDARWFSYGTNKLNGLHRSNEDKQRAVKAALAHPKGAKMSDSQIARHVGVHQTTVSEWRAKLKPTQGNLKSTSRTGRDGRTINVGNIGKSRPAAVTPIHVVAPDLHARATNRALANFANTPALTADQRAAITVSAYMKPFATAPNSVEEAIMEISLYIMTSPLDLREELLRRLHASLDLSIATMDREASRGRA